MDQQSVLYKQLIASPEQVSVRVSELAGEVIARYRGKNVLFVCLLRGGAPFAAQLMFAIAQQDPQFHPELDYMTVKTYGTERTDKPSELIMDLSPSTQTEGRLVVLLDDVLDKGITADFAAQHLRARGAVGVDVVVLVQKDRIREHYPQATLYGFLAPEGWLTGMGLDDARIAPEANRWAGFVAIANDAE